MKILIVQENSLEKYEKKLIDINNQFEIIEVIPNREHENYFARVTIKNSDFFKKER